MAIPAIAGVVLRAIASKAAKGALPSKSPAVGGFGLKLEKGPGWKKEIEKLGATPFVIEETIKNELISTAVFIRNRIIRSMRKTPKTGRIYNRGTKQHISSSPGYAPAVDTAGLLKSIKMDVRMNEVEVGSNLTGKLGKYPTFLEFGTKNMDARPWLGPAVDEGERLFMATIRRRIENAIKRV